MNIDELLNDLVIASKYKEQIVNFNNLQKHIHTEEFSRVYSTIVEFLKPFPKIKRKFIKGYESQPEGCTKKNVIVFSTLNKNGTANNLKWIARMPLLQNNASVIIYFPRSIIVESNLYFRFEHVESNETSYEYAIPVDIQGFINNPEQFISIDAISKRLNHR